MWWPVVLRRARMRKASELAGIWRAFREERGGAGVEGGGVSVAGEERTARERSGAEWCGCRSVLGERRKTVFPEDSMAFKRTSECVIQGSAERGGKEFQVRLTRVRS